MPGSLLVNGIELTPERRLKELRAACSFYGISASGSKLKCYQRLVPIFAWVSPKHFS